MKTLTADKVLKFLKNLQEQGADLKTIKVNYREDYDSDVVSCVLVEEDLFDEETNSVLTSICIVSKNLN